LFVGLVMWCAGSGSGGGTNSSFGATPPSGPADVDVILCAERAIADQMAPIKMEFPRGAHVAEKQPDGNWFVLMKTQCTIRGTRMEQDFNAIVREMPGTHRLECIYVGGVRWN